LSDGARKGEIFRTIHELEKHYARIAGEAESLGPSQLVFLGAGLIVGMVSFGLLAWLLVIPLDGRVSFVLALGAAAGLGGATTVWCLGRARPRASAQQNAAMEALRKRIDEAKSDYEKFRADPASHTPGPP
jgi:Flp pilus assembly protein TadB